MEKRSHGHNCTKTLLSLSYHLPMFQQFNHRTTGGKFPFFVCHEREDFGFYSDLGLSYLASSFSSQGSPFSPTHHFIWPLTVTKRETIPCHSIMNNCPSPLSRYIRLVMYIVNINCYSRKQTEIACFCRAVIAIGAAHTTFLSWDKENSWYLALIILERHQCLVLTYSKKRKKSA